MPVDEHPVEEGIEHVGHADHREDRVCPRQRLQALSDHDKQEEGQDTGNRSAHVCGCHRNDRRRLMQGEERRLYGKKQHTRDRRQADGDEKPALDAARDTLSIARADCLRDDGVEDHQDSRGGERDEQKEQISQRHGSQRFRGHAPDHERIDNAHRHDGHLRAHDGKRQACHLLEVGPSWQSHRASKSGVVG